VTVYTDSTVRQRPEKTSWAKKPSGEKRTWQEIWVGMAQALNSPSYETTQEMICFEKNALKNRVE